MNDAIRGSAVPEPATVREAEIDAPFTLAANVNHARNAAGMSLDDLAGAARVPVWGIKEIERGDADPRLTVIARLAFALGVPTGDLLSRTDAAASTDPTTKCAVVRPTDPEIP